MYECKMKYIVKNHMASCLTRYWDLQDVLNFVGSYCDALSMQKNGHIKRADFIYKIIQELITSSYFFIRDGAYIYTIKPDSVLKARELAYKIYNSFIIRELRVLERLKRKEK